MSLPEDFDAQFPGTGIPLLDAPKAHAIVRRHCREASLSLRQLERLVGAELEQIGKRRKRGLAERLDEILDGDQEERIATSRFVCEEQAHFAEALEWAEDVERFWVTDPRAARESLARVLLSLKAAIRRCGIHARTLHAIVSIDSQQRPRGVLGTSPSHRPGRRPPGT